MEVIATAHQVVVHLMVEPQMVELQAVVLLMADLQVVDLLVLLTVGFHLQSYQLLTFLNALASSIKFQASVLVLTRVLLKRLDLFKKLS